MPAEVTDLKLAATKNPAGAKTAAKSKPVDQTFEEAKYLRQLIKDETRVGVKLTDGAIVTGRIEYYDVSFIRVTRDQEPNLFIFKHDILYLWEEE